MGTGRGSRDIAHVEFSDSASFECWRPRHLVFCFVCLSCADQEARCRADDGCGYTTGCTQRLFVSSYRRHRCRCNGRPRAFVFHSRCASVLHARNRILVVRRAMERHRAIRVTFQATACRNDISAEWMAAAIHLVEISKHAESRLSISTRSKVPELKTGLFDHQYV